jgi:type IV fimbrial biogenesis protein FimT
MHQRGFSLIELLMGLTIAGIVLLLVSPAFAAFTQSTHRDEAAQSILGGIRTARTLAISRNEVVMIYGINGDWSQGWRIIRDITGKGPDDSDNPVIAEHANSDRVKVIGNKWVKHYIRFTRLGEPLMPHGAFQGGTLHFCDNVEPVSRRQIVLSPTGRTRLLNQNAEQAQCQEQKTYSSERTRSSLGMEKVMFSSRPANSSAPVAPHACNC